MSKHAHEITAGKSDAGRRLDIVIAGRLKDYSRSRIKGWIGRGHVKIDGQPQKSSYKVRAGDVICITAECPKELSAEPQNIPLDIIYEDGDIVVVNKPAGMVVHPAAGNPDGTLVNALLYHCKDLSGIGGVLRPGIVHRLDKETSGVIIVAKSDRAHESLTRQFKERSVRKVYYAIVYGVPRAASGRIDAAIGRHKTERKKMSTKTRRGREAITCWELVERFGKGLSLMKIRILTGRTHQIRVHFASRGMPLLGDGLYGGRRTIKRLPEGAVREIAAGAHRLMLHAASLSVEHPVIGEMLLFNAELPDDFKAIIEGLRNATI